MIMTVESNINYYHGSKPCVKRFLIKAFQSIRFETICVLRFFLDVSE